ncbi:hypothetical protein JTB14_027315 [Gonioctena quinquepunctata]|nr:hypothetical protein JTB14_027315 [Gonioctena quinquepunctata]
MFTCLAIHSWARNAIGKYKIKTQRQSWDENSMRQAVEEVLEGRMGYLKASRESEVPRTTIEARVKKIEQGVLNKEDSAKQELGHHKPVFSPAQEKESVEYILCMKSRLFDLTLDALRSLAFELAERNGLSNRFNKDKKKAGKAWLYAFLNRHLDIKLRSIEPTPLAMSMGFNRHSVEQFFSLLTEMMEKHKIPPERIYNLDETGIMTVPKKRSKCLSLRGKQQVGCLSSAERGVWVLVVYSPRTLPTSPFRKPPSITTILTKQFYANSTPSCSHTTQNFVVTPQQRRHKAKNPNKKDISSSEKEKKRQKYTKGKKRRKSRESNDSSSEDESEEATCIFCSEFYSNSKAEEGWIRCQHCEGWAHEACAGVGEDEVFICDFCQ